MPIEVYPVVSAWQAEKYDGTNLQAIRDLFPERGVWVNTLSDSMNLVIKNEDERWTQFVNIGDYVLRSGKDHQVLSEYMYKQKFYTK